jgi:hypothetical protein
MNRRTRSQCTTAVVLLLFAGCVGGEGGECCGGASQPSTAAPPASTEAASATVDSTTASPTQESPGSTVATQEASAPEVPASAPPDFSDPSWTRVASRAEQYLVYWRTPAGAVPRNEDFELEVWVLRDGAPARDAELAVSAWMPDHGHGMLRLPRTERRGDGSFHVQGMLLHMRGLWQLRFDVVESALAETAECALEL